MASIVEQVPVFIVEIAGRRISGNARACVASFEFDEKEKQTAEATLVLTGSTGERLLVAIPQKGDLFRVRWGWLGQLSDTHEMRVHSVEPSYGTTVSYKITARDLGDGMGRAVRRGAFHATELGQVVQELAKRHGLEAVLPRAAQGMGAAAAAPSRAWLVDQSPSSPREAQLLREVVNLAQHGESDRQLLQRIAHRVGCEVHIVGKQLRFLPKGYAAAPALALRYRGGRGALLSFAPKEGQGSRHQVAARGVAAAGVDPDTGKSFAALGDNASTPGRPVLGKESTFGGPARDGTRAGGGDVLQISQTDGEPIGRRAVGPPTAAPGAVLPTPSGNASDASRNAQALHADAEGGAVTASFQMIGMPSVRRGRILDVSGLLRRRDNGPWMVTAVTHKLDVNGYQVSGELKRHGQQAVAKNKQPTAGKANGLAPRQAEQVRQPFYAVSPVTGDTMGLKVQ